MSEIIPFHELPENEPSRVWHKGKGVICENGSEVELWHALDRNGFMIILRRDLGDSKKSELKFGMTSESAYALYRLFDAAFYEDATTLPSEC